MNDPRKFIAKMCIVGFAREKILTDICSGGAPSFIISEKKAGSFQFSILK